MDSKIKKRRTSDLSFKLTTYVLLILGVLVVLYPLIYVVSASVSQPSTVTSGKLWLFPVDLSFRAYELVFQNQNLLRGFANSVLYTVVGTVINLIVTICAAYPLARKDLRGKKFFMAYFTFTMLFSGGMIASYMVVNKLHMLDTLWSLILPGALSVWNMVIMKTYFQSTIPEELYEAATLDGSSDFGFLLRIVLPLSTTVLGVIGIYYAIGHWNSYFTPMMYLTDMKKYPLQLILREILILGQIDQSSVKGMLSEEFSQGVGQLLKYAVIVVSSLPMILVYAFMQKFFVKGVMIGAIKG